MSKTLLVGIDVHSEKNYCAFTDDLGNRLHNKAFPIPNNLPGAQQLEKRIESAMQEGSFNSIKIATEATSFLDLHLVDYLSNSKSLSKYLPLIYQFNPKLTAGLKKAYADIDKTDYIDPFIIAERLRFAKLPEPYEGSKIYFPLKRLTRYRHHLVNSIAREKNYFLTHLSFRFALYTDNHRKIYPVSPSDNGTGRLAQIHKATTSSGHIQGHQSQGHHVTRHTTHVRTSARPSTNSGLRFARWDVGRMPFGREICPDVSSGRNL